MNRHILTNQFVKLCYFSIFAQIIAFFPKKQNLMEFICNMYLLTPMILFPLQLYILLNFFFIIPMNAFILSLIHMYS